MDTQSASGVAKRAKEIIEAKWWQLEKEVASKRNAWFDTPEAASLMRAKPSPRTAFDAFFLTYMGLAPSDVPVVSETEDEIVWDSVNPCPTLEACALTGKDTREFCRAVYERPTQHFLSRFDPELRFVRSYSEIRPHAAHCRESIVRVPFEPMMRIALDEARQSKLEGNKGYGAVVTMGAEVISRAHDTAGTQRDPSKHAEVNALRLAVKKTGDPNLCGAILFSTCEPCPMCASLAVWSNITSFVYGASIEETSALGRTRIQVGVRTIVENSPACIEVIGGVLREECLQLYRY